jgi:hypothetical protein
VAEEEGRRLAHTILYVKDGPPLRMELRVLSHMFSGIIKKSAGHSVYDRHLIRDSWPMGGFFFLGLKFQ